MTDDRELAATPTAEELRDARIRSYRSMANGLIIHSSRFLGTFDISDMHPAMFADWVRLATQVHGQADALDVDTMAEHRRKYRETITRAPE